MTKEKNNKFNWQILLIIMFAGIIAGIYRNGIMTLFPFLQEEYSLSRAQVGLYSTFLYISSTGVAIFSGRFADHWGVKRSMIGGLILMGVFIALHSLAPSFMFILIFALLTGLGFSIIVPTSSKGIAEWYPAENQSTVMGLMTLGFPIGGVIGSLVLPWIGKNFGWRSDIILISVLLFLAALLFKYYYKDKPKKVKNKEKKEKRKNSLFEDITIILKNKYMLTLCLLGIMFGLASGIVATHFTLFLYMDYGYTEVLAGIGFMVLQLGSMASRPFWGLVNDRVFNNQKRYGFLILGIIISLVSIVLAVMSNYSPSLPIILFFAFLLGGSGRGWQGLYFSAVSEQVGEDDTGLGIGLSMVFVRLGILSGPPIFGYFADQADSYSYSWLLLGIIMISVIIVSYYFLTKFNSLKEVSQS
ncbi:MAG: MFS transporter [Halanaerobiales bacterium]|nr:MFS transporter [Halanaerobiales bacterium]